MTLVEPTTHVAFVRAVMIGREGLHREVLIDMFARSGAGDVVSYLSTGNVSFTAPAADVDRIVGRVEADLERLLGRRTPLFVRSLDDLRGMLAGDPFAAAPIEEVNARIITFFLDGVPDAIEVPTTAPNDDWVVFAAGPRELFSVTRAWPDRQPHDPGGWIQNAAGELVTSRAVGTVERIVHKLTDST